MKKIIGAALLGTMAAGVFAADAKISLQLRSKLDAYSQRELKLGDEKVTTKEGMDWAGYDGAGRQQQNNSADTFKFAMNDENAGVTIGFNLTESNAAPMVLNEYSAWMKFNAGPGVLTLRSGNWKDGYADGNYRVKKDVDAMSFEGFDYETFKLGTIFDGTQTLKFADDLTFGKGQTSLSGFADYNYKVSDDLAVNFLVGGTYDSSFDRIEKGADTNHVKHTYWNSKFSSRIQVNMKNLLNAELIYKKPAPGYNTFALYVMPQLMKELALNVGGAVELGGEVENEAKDNKWEDYTVWGVDLRARYQVNDALSVTFFTNVSGTDKYNGLALASGLAGRKGAWGWSQITDQSWAMEKGDLVKNALDKDGVGKNKDTSKVQLKTAMWNQLGFRYTVNDMLAATLNAGLLTPLVKAKNDDGSKDKSSYSPEWRVTPGVQVYAASNAFVWAGVALSGSTAKFKDDDGSTKFSSFNFDIPVIFRVRM